MREPLPRRDGAATRIVIGVNVDHPVVIAAFRSADEAAHARTLLEREAIAAAAIDRQESIERLCADVFEGGFDVVVELADVARAIAVLQRAWPEEKLLDAHVIDRCAACGSVDVERLPRIRIFIGAALILIAASLVFGQRDLFLLVIAIIGGVLVLTPARHCRACGERWS